MCGIAGLVCFSESCNGRNHSSLVGKMCCVQTHRGPDDNGVVALDNVCLGAVRLSILDLTEAGHMPMADASGRWWISYNGEVYNFKELREELRRCGHAFRSQTDTEVVLHAFMEWGVQCLERFVGMFAFSVYDRETDAVTLVRDRFGIKPLYYMQCGTHVLFSSEIKSLIRVGPRPRLNKQSLIEWSLYRNVDVLSPATLFEDISTVLPGQCVTIRSGKVAACDYYKPQAQVDEGEYRRFASSPAQAVISEIGAALQQGVRDRLVSDVPVGTLCSGGLDSSLVTAMAARHTRQLTAFHVSIAEDTELDERKHAEALTKDLGIPLITYALTGEVYRRELARAVYLSDLPLSHPNSVAYFLICQAARANGVIVLLSGEGADELFGGYAWRYRRQRRLLRAQRFFNLLPRKIRKGIELAGFSCAGLPVTSLRFDELLPQTIAFIDGYARKEWHMQCENAYSFVTDLDDRAILGTILGDLSDFLSPLLRRLDRMSMGASVECRVPFLDHRLVHKAVNLPLNYRLSRRTDKWVLKQIASQYLPASLVTRKKMGFPLPLREYLAPLAHNELFTDGFFCEVLGMSPRSINESMANWHENPYAFLSLVSLELWGRQFLLHEPLEQVNELIARLEHRHAHCA